MTGAGHTAGEWKRNPACMDEIVADSETLVVCRVPSAKSGLHNARAPGNARLIVAACNSYDRHFGERAVSAAEGDLLGRCLEAIRTVVATRSDHFTARNGRRCSIEGDDGEKCWIIPFDVMTDLEAILSQAQAREVRSS